MNKNHSSVNEIINNLKIRLVLYIVNSNTDGMGDDKLGL